MQNKHRAEPPSTIEISKLPAVAGGFYCRPFEPYRPVAPRALPCPPPGFGFEFRGYGVPGYEFADRGWVRR